MALDARDIPLLAAAGNDGTEIEAYPTLLVKPLEGTRPVLGPNLMAVDGFLINDGDFFNDIRDPEIEIYGPADDESGGTPLTPGLECASRDRIGYHNGEFGTSHGNQRL